MPAATALVYVEPARRCGKTASRIDAIVADAAVLLRVPVRLIMSRDRSDSVFRARAAVCWVADKTTGLGVARLGRLLGRDHSSIIHAIARAEAMRASDDDFREATVIMVAAALRRARR
jgi:chromosomal replication initiation ATPase DnaA